MAYDQRPDAVHRMRRLAIDQEGARRQRGEEDALVAQHVYQHESTEHDQCRRQRQQELAAHPRQPLPSVRDNVSRFGTVIYQASPLARDPTTNPLDRR